MGERPDLLLHGFCNSLAATNVEDSLACFAGQDVDRPAAHTGQPDILRTRGGSQGDWVPQRSRIGARKLLMSHEVVARGSCRCEPPSYRRRSVTRRPLAGRQMRPSHLYVFPAITWGDQVTVALPANSTGGRQFSAGPTSPTMSGILGSRQSISLTSPSDQQCPAARCSGRQVDVAAVGSAFAGRAVRAFGSDVRAAGVAFG